MCGFSGVFLGAAGRSERLAADVNRMAAALQHRGPDDDGVWVDPTHRVAFAFRRLAIQDLSPAGHQPMVSRSGRYTMVFNGEVYNFEQIRAQVGLPRSEYRGGSDTEVLLAAFDRFGVEATLPMMNGMFAIAVWDQSEDELWLIRDRIGIKPLYYARTSKGIAFASELGALTLAEGFDQTLDPGAIAAYLRYIYVPAPSTPFANTRKLLPGHTLRIRNPESMPVPSSFWSLATARSRGASQRSDPAPTSHEGAVETLNDLLSDSVRLRMIADVPVGALLSGGIDSTLITALMQEHSSRPARTFTVGFGDSPHDESRHARAVAEHLGTDHTELQVTGKDALDLVPRLPEIFDEPLANPSQVPTYLVSALARESVTVALSGDGGDELFAGYNRYRHGPAMAGRISRIPAIPRRWLGAALRSLPIPAWDRLAAIAPSGVSGLRLPGQKMHKLARMMRASSRADSYQILMSGWDMPERLMCEKDTDVDALRAALDRASDPLELDEMLFLDQMFYLPDDLLHKVDRASMGVSLEVRVPLLDHRVVEESWRICRDLKIRDGQGKWILRELVYRRVPSELMERPKTGFSVPVEDWLAGPLRSWCEDLLLASSPARDALFDKAEVSRAWSGFVHGKTELALGIWSLVMFEAWRRHWKIDAIAEEIKCAS